MSYWTWLEIDTGGIYPARVTDSRNMTSNVSPMWATALGFGYRELKGQLAAVAIPHLERAVAHMKALENTADYRAMEPANGWGNLDYATRYLEELLVECRAHPRSTINMSH